MATRSETLRLTPEALSEALDAAGLTLSQFCHLFDVGYDNARRWTYPDTHPKACEPPYWVTPVLNACRDPGQLYDFRCDRADNTATQGAETDAA